MGTSAHSKLPAHQSMSLAQKKNISHHYIIHIFRQAPRPPAHVKRCAKTYNHKASYPPNYTWHTHTIVRVWSPRVPVNKTTTNLMYAPCTPYIPASCAPKSRISNAHLVGYHPRNIYRDFSRACSLMMFYIRLGRRLLNSLRSGERAL